MKKRIIIIVFLVLLIGVGGLVYFGQRESGEKELFYSGTIEATESDISFQVSGRVNRVFVDEGKSVTEGQVLAEIDKSEFESRYKQAKANHELAVKNYSKAELALEISKKILPLEVERALAGVQATKAKLDELKSGFRKQEVEQARLGLQALKATLEESKKNRDRYETLLKRGIVSDKDYDLVKLKYETSLKDYERAEEQLSLLREGYRPEDIRSLQAQLAQNEAVLNQARNNLKQIELRQREAEAARAQVEAAAASLELARTQMQYTEIKAPFKGIVTVQAIEPGEVVMPSRIAITVADLSVIELKIFVPETEIGYIKPDQKVEVKVDSFPDKSFWGKVAYISPQAEFTPKIIQTHKERVKLVYLVKVDIPNPDLELKPGMPADAWLVEE